MTMVGNRALVVLVLGMGCSKEYDITPIAPVVDPGTYMDCEFSEVEGAPMKVYDCNPVFDTTGEEWGPEVGSVGFYTNLVLGHPVYQIWYQASLDEEDYRSDWGLGTAISTNGTDWEPHSSNPLLAEESGAWDQNGMGALQVVRDDFNDRYVMAYQGYAFDGSSWDIGVGVASSEDGVSWNGSEANPVLSQAIDYGGMYITWPLALYASDGGGVTAYVAGRTASGPVNMYASQVSDDLSRWDIMDSPVLEAGPEAYDQAGIADASVVKVGDTYYMFYIGFEDWEDIDGGARKASIKTLNLATSTSGISWQKHPDNPLPVHLAIEPDDPDVSAVAAQVVGDRIHLWVTDKYGDSDAVGYYLFNPAEL